MPDALLTYRLRTFLAAIPSPSIVCDSPHDRALCQLVLDEPGEAEADATSLKASLSRLSQVMPYAVE